MNNVILSPIDTGQLNIDFDGLILSLNLVTYPKYHNQKYPNLLNPAHLPHRHLSLQ